MLSGASPAGPGPGAPPPRRALAPGTRACAARPPRLTVLPDVAPRLALAPTVQAIPSVVKGVSQLDVLALARPQALGPEGCSARGRCTDEALVATPECAEARDPANPDYSQAATKHFLNAVLEGLPALLENVGFSPQGGGHVAGGRWAGGGRRRGRGDGRGRRGRAGHERFVRGCQLPGQCGESMGCRIQEVRGTLQADPARTHMTAHTAARGGGQRCPHLKRSRHHAPPRTCGLHRARRPPASRTRGGSSLLESAS